VRQWGAAKNPKRTVFQYIIKDKELSEDKQSLAIVFFFIAQQSMEARALVI
jgi:hypothetical protein